jgi:two-component system response regulator LytT
MQKPAAASDRLAVLLVEDHDFLRLLFVRTFTDRHEVHSVATVRDGWSSFLKLNPDIVFIDLHLPDGDGYELAQRIKKVRPHTYVVITTASEEAALRTETGSSDQIDGFILKPFDRKRIVSFMERCLEERRKRLLCSGLT